MTARYAALCLSTVPFYPRISTETSQVNGPYASAPAWRRGPLRVVRVVGQGTGSLYSSCLRIFSALDGWEDVGDPELLVVTRQNNFDVRSILTWRRLDKIGRCPLCEYTGAVHSRTWRYACIVVTRIFRARQPPWSFPGNHRNTEPVKVLHT